MGARLLRVWAPTMKTKRGFADIFKETPLSVDECKSLYVNICMVLEVYECIIDNDRGKI